MENSNIIASIVKATGKPPPTLRQVGTNNILNRVILEWSSHLGSYGMGGPGFVGFRLDGNESRSTEWLVLTLWGADSWLLLDDRWVGAHPKYYHIQKPLFSYYNKADGGKWDEVAELVVGTRITEAEVANDSCSFYLAKEDKIVTLKVPKDTSKLPRLAGPDTPRTWLESEHMLDAWVVTEDPFLFLTD